MSYIYDEVNRLEKVKDWLNQITSYSYDPAGNLVKTSLPNGVRTTYEYDQANRLLNLTNVGQTGKSANEKALPSFSYTYDSNGNRIKVVERDEGKKEEITKYGYDPLNQLIRAAEENRARTYAYDKAGSRLSLVKTKGKGKEKEAVYEYNEANQLLKITEKDKVTTFSYDESGNMIAQVKFKDEEIKETRTYTYDFKNRLIKVEIVKNGETKIVEYEYDGLGNRISRIETKPDEGGEKETVYYVNDISNPLAEVLQERGENNDVMQSYVYGLDLVSKINEKNKLDYYLYDGLGSVVGLTNEQGSLIARYSYDEFGVPDPEGKFDSHAHHGNVYGFTGEQWDENVGLLYLRARYYQPEVGRFVTKDPFPGLIALPQTLPPYLYCQNNPTNLVDPQGRIAPLLVAVLGGAAAGAFAGGVGYTAGTVISNAVNGKPLFSDFSWTDFTLSAAGGAMGGAAITVTGVTAAGATAIGAGVSAGQYLAGSWIKGEEITFGGYVSSVVSGSVAGLVGGGANIPPLYGFARGTIGETVSPFITNAIDYQLSQYNIYGVPRSIDPMKMYVTKGGK